MLQVENMTALCQLSSNWYGLLVSWADNKKKSNLMLITLEPGTNAIPWLGDIQNLTLSPTELSKTGKHLFQHNVMYMYIYN
jgi:hypothetical protein